MPKIFIVSLGCPKNLTDAEVMAGELAAAGWELTGDEASADAALINTCAFLGSAVKESEAEIKRLLGLKARGELAKVMVTGCLVEREKEGLLRRFPALDAVVGIHALSKAALALEKNKNYISPAGSLNSPRLKARLTAPHSAYLKIADGCDNRCAYCLLPSIRGAFRSKPFESVMEEARRLSGSGAVEISLIAQDTTSYGIDLYGKPRLAGLLKGLSGIKGVKWWRLMYAYPERLTNEILAVMRDNENICRYLDMPLQHISDPVLRRMNRASTERSIKAKLAELRRLMPGIAVRTNLIAGFPGETREDFNRLLAFVKEARFDGLGVFPYSREHGTSAAGLPDQVPERVKKERVEELLLAQSGVVDALNAGLKGKKLDVLMDSPRSGRTYRDAPEIDGRVEIQEVTGHLSSRSGDKSQVTSGKKKSPLKAGDFVKVKITGASGYLRRGTLL